MSGGGQLVTSGPLILALPVAAAAGAVTFLSPCVLPLVPGYLSFVTGMAGASGGSGGSGAQPAASLSQGQAASPDGAGDDPGVGDGSAVGDGSGVAGAARPLTVPAPARGGLGHLLTGHARLLTQVLGGLTIVLGFLFAGAFDRFSFAGRIVRPSTRPKAGLAGAPLLGVMFGLGWAPCTGPTLSAVLALSASTGTVTRGAILALVYALRLRGAFLLVALGFQVVMRASAFARRHARLVTRIGGAMLVCVGLLEVTGAWSTFMAWLQVHWVSNYQSPI